jgi:hypothetical protein
LQREMDTHGVRSLMQGDSLAQQNIKVEPRPP